MVIKWNTSEKVMHSIAFFMEKGKEMFFSSRKWYNETDIKTLKMKVYIII